MNEFDTRVSMSQDPGGLYARTVDTIQANIGLRCDLQCSHCHVVSSPRRTETMSWETMAQVLEAAALGGVNTVDITGGAPELNPHFRRFVSELRKGGIAVTVRTNLTVFSEPGMEDIHEFYREHRVQLVASLPCYQEKNVDTQRGDRVFEKSVAAIRKLNALGYGKDPDLPLDLVYNPLGSTLPPRQAALETDYKRALSEEHGLFFTRLITITNMPIGRFRADLRRRNGLDDYDDLLRRSFNPRAADGLMCRSLISVRWDGVLFDCDFNLALKQPIGNGSPLHIDRFDPRELAGRRIRTSDHCFGCTAGYGSSCGGALVEGES